MRHRPLVVLAALMLVCLPGCGGSDLSFDDEYGDEVTVTTGRTVVLVGLATWCPYSGVLVNCLKDPAFAAHARNYEFHFVFDDEWPTVTKMLQEQMGVSRSEAQRQAAAFRDGDSPLFDPSFLDTLPAGQVLFVNDKTPHSPDSFPVVATMSGRFAQHPVEWFDDQDAKAGKTLARLWDAHARAIDG